MKFTINIEKRFAYAIIGILLVILGVLVVWAYNSGQNPAFVGHTAEELDLSGGVNGNAVFNGNVGIGTATPQAKLDVKDGFIYNTKTDATIARIGLKNSIREWAISAYGNDFAPNGGLVISDETAPRAVMIFNTNGNVGIGTPNPTQKLDVNGNIQFNSVLQTAGRMHITGGERLYILNKDGVFISKAWGGNGNLNVEGNINSGTIHASQICLNGDCRTSWPSASSGGGSTTCINGQTTGSSDPNCWYECQSGTWVLRCA